MGYRVVKHDDVFSRFDTVPACDRRTDGRTDRQNCYINIARQWSDAIIKANFASVPFLLCQYLSTNVV